MRIPPLTLAALLTLGHGALTAQGPWGKVRAWTGTVTVEATETKKFATYSSTMTYTATGGFTIADDALGDGDHVTWPMPNPELASDPARYAAAYEPWQAHVVASYEATGKDLEGNAFTTRCTADNQKASGLGVMVSPGTSDYVFSVSLPEALFKCATSGTGTGPTPTGRFQQAALQLTGPQGAAGPVAGSKTFTTGDRVIKVAFSMKPVT